MNNFISTIALMTVASAIRLTEEDQDEQGSTPQVLSPEACAASQLLYFMDYFGDEDQMVSKEEIDDELTSAGIEWYDDDELMKTTEELEKINEELKKALMDAAADGPISFEDGTNVILEVFAGEEEAFWDMMYITTGSGKRAYTERVDGHKEFLE